MTITPVYASATEVEKKPNISINPIIQKVNAGSFYRYTAFGTFTADPGSTYEILEWGALFFAAPDTTTLPTTISYNTSTGKTETQNILSTDTNSTYFMMLSNTSESEANPTGQYAANIDVKTSRTIYVRMFLRYSYTDSATGETVYVVTYSDTYTFSSAAYSASGASEFITPTLWYKVPDLDPSDYDNLF